MNILFLYLTAIAPQKGGVSRVTTVLSDELERRGHQIFYLSTTKEHKNSENVKRQHYLPNTAKTTSAENLIYYKQFLQSNKIDVVVFQAGVKKFPWKKFKGHPPLICSLHVDPRFYEAVVFDKYGIIKTTKNSPQGKLYDTIKRHVGIPLKIFLRRRKMASVYKYNYDLCDSFVVLSGSHRTSMRELIHKKTTREDKISVMPNPSSFSPVLESLQKEKCLLWAGRLSLKQKRPDLMIEIWRKLEEKFPEWTLEILGNGDDSEYVKNLAKSKQLKRIRFRGFVSPEPYFQKTPILCMTSSNEGFPMVIIEASAFGCVPVAFNSFEVAEELISSWNNGILIAPFDLDSYAMALEKLMTYPTTTKNLSLNAVENAKRFEIGTITDKWEQLFQNLCKQ